MREVARGIRLALESDECGETFNLAEQACAPIGLWMRLIASAAGAEVEFVRVPDAVLPEDLEIAGSIPQHWLVDSSKARERLDWVHVDYEKCVRQSVQWHLDNAPEERPSDFSADEKALSAVAESADFVA